MKFFTIALMLTLPLLAIAQAAPDDPGVIITALLGAIQGRNWTVVVGLALTGITLLARRFGGTYVPWLKTDRGGATLGISVSVLGAVGTVLAAGQLSASTILDAVALATTNAGTYALIKKLLKPSDAPTASVPKGFAALPLMLALAAALAFALPALSRAEEPKFGGCLSNKTTCFGPTVSINLLAISLKTGDVTTQFSPGIGYGVTFHALDWYRYGLSANFALKGTADGQRAQVSVVGSFAEYLRLGLTSVLGAGDLYDHAAVLLAFGSEFGSGR